MPEGTREPLGNMESCRSDRGHGWILGVWKRDQIQGAAQWAVCGLGLLVLFTGWGRLTERQACAFRGGEKSRFARS